MKQFVVKSLYESSEIRGEDLISLDEGKITKIHDVLAIALRHYMAVAPRHSVGVNISKMPLNEFKQEFLESDEELKITILYGHLTHKNVFIGELRGAEDEYVIGLNKNRGFKMVTINLEPVSQSEIVDIGDNFYEYIEQEKASSVEKKEWAKKTEDVQKFISGLKTTAKKEGGLGKKKPPITARGAGGKLTAEKGTVPLASGKVLQDVFSQLGDSQAVQNIKSRISEKDGQFVYRLITPSELFMEYQVLASNLAYAQHLANLPGAGEEAQELLEFAKEGMRAHKSNLNQIALNLANRYGPASLTKLFLPKVKGRHQPHHWKEAHSRISSFSRFVNSLYYGRRKESAETFEFGRDIYIDQKGLAYKVLERYTEDSVIKPIYRKKDKIVGGKVVAKAGELIRKGKTIFKGDVKKKVLIPLHLKKYGKFPIKNPKIHKPLPESLKKRKGKLAKDWISQYMINFEKSMKYAFKMRKVRVRKRF